MWFPEDLENTPFNGLLTLCSFSVLKTEKIDTQHVLYHQVLWRPPKGTPGPRDAHGSSRGSLIQKFNGVLTLYLFSVLKTEKIDTQHALYHQILQRPFLDPQGPPGGLGAPPGGPKVLPRPKGISGYLQQWFRIILSFYMAHTYQFHPSQHRQNVISRLLN